MPPRAARGRTRRSAAEVSGEVFEVMAGEATAGCPMSNRATS
jgi:hypothetical protein